MRRPIAIAALVSAVLILGAAGSAGAVTNGDCAGGGFVPAWSPNGKEIAWIPPADDGICFARPDGVQPRFMSLPQDLVTPTEMLWARPGLLVALNDANQLFSVSTRGRPHVLGKGRRFTGASGDTFSLDVRGDILATGSDGVGPVQILRPNGTSHSIGDDVNANIRPSLSLYGQRVVWEKDATGDPPGIWTERTDASHGQEIEQSGMCPLWSPAGPQIAYVDGGNLILIPDTGGAGVGVTLATTVTGQCGVPQSIAWSPNARRIAFRDSGNHLSVVDVQTKRVWTLRFSHGLHGFAWSPDSRQLFFSAGNPRGCKSLWRAHVNGGRLIRVSHC